MQYLIAEYISIKGNDNIYVSILTTFTITQNTKNVMYLIILKIHGTNNAMLALQIGRFDLDRDDPLMLSNIIGQAVVSCWSMNENGRH